MNTKPKKACVFSASGIGDGLLMLIASHRLHNLGYEVTTYHNKLSELSTWFPDHHFAPLPPLSDLAAHLFQYDLVIAQNDNRELIGQLTTLRDEQIIKKLSVFYPTYEKKKHKLMQFDQVFNKSLPMAENVARAIARLMNMKDTSKNNGLTIPKNLIRKKYPNRIVIHPMSQSEQKNWPREKYLKLAKKLHAKGFEPIFAMTIEEKKDWGDCPYPVPDFKTLDVTASYLVESGTLIGNDSALGHLASNAHLPTLIISDCKRRMQLWRPGWLLGSIITPTKAIPNVKYLRLRRTHWKKWIPVRSAYKKFKSLTLRSNDVGHG